MSRRPKVNAKARAYKREQRVRDALGPFARVDIPTGEDGEDVWLYVGKRDTGSGPPHLTLEDFRRARRECNSRDAPP